MEQNHIQKNVPCEQLLGYNSMQVSYISIHFTIRSSDSLCSGLSFFKDVCATSKLKRGRVCLSWAERVCLFVSFVFWNLIKIMSLYPTLSSGRFIVYYKRFSFPNLGTPQLWCKTTACEASTWAHLYHSYAMWEQGTLTQVTSCCCRPYYD